MNRKANNSGGRRLTTSASVNAAVKSICDIMRPSNCTCRMGVPDGIR